MHHNDFTKIPTTGEPIPFKEVNLFKLTLPCTRNKIASPKFLILFTQINNPAFCPGKGFLLDANPFVLEQDLPIDCWIFAQDGESHQFFHSQAIGEYDPEG